MKTNKHSQSALFLFASMVCIASITMAITATAQPSSFVLAEYYYPLVAGNEWRYSGTDYDAQPARRIVRVDDLSAAVTAYAGCSNPQAYVTNLVRFYHAYALPGTLTSYDDWYEFVGTQGTNQGILSYWGGDDDGESIRANGGGTFPQTLKLGQFASVSRELFDGGVCLGTVTIKFTAVSWGSVTVPAGTFDDCLKVRITISIGGQTQAQDEWWARGVGAVKLRNVPDNGEDQNDLEFYQVVSPARILGGPASRTNNLGTTATFSVTVMGTPPLTYGWKKNGTNLVDTAHVSGSTNGTLTIQNVDFSDAGSYTVAVSNNVSGTVSAPAALIVKETIPPSLSVSSHTDFQLVASASTTISGTASDAGTGDSGISSVTINGVRASNDTSSGSVPANWNRVQPLTPGTNKLAIVARDGQGNSTTNLLRLISDTTRPTTTFTSPADGSRIFSPALDVLGRASDKLRIAAVFVQRGGDAWIQASGTTNWSAPLNLESGPNTINAYSVDIAGNRSLTNKITITYVVTAPLTLSTNGSGSVSGATNGQFLEIGLAYTIVAKPSLKNLFINWSGSQSSAAATLTFLMQSNQTFVANFVTNPFVGLKGRFNGLFSEDTDLRNHDRSGNFTLTLAEAGTYSASFQLGAKKLPAKGAFDWLGQSLLKLKPTVSSTVMVSLQLDVTNLSAVIDGTVIGDDWESPLIGDRAPVYPLGTSSPLAGKYTLVIPGSNDAANSPGGDSYGTVTISKAGSLLLAGKLADNTILSQTVPVSAEGWWPLHALLYTGKGSLHGWMQFTNEDSSDIAGTLSWIKLTNSAAKFYRAGFTNEHDAVGSAYVPPTTNRVINMTNGTVEFRLGNLLESITNNVLLTTNNKITNLSSNKLTLTFTLTSGLFKGSVTDTNTGKAIPFTGALLQKLDSGYGHFLGTNQSGQVHFAPVP